MKKILFTLLLVAIATVSMSQASVEVGLKVGANFANTDYSEISTDAITSFHGGAYGLVKFANIGIQPEVLWSKQGSELNVSGLTSDIDFTYVNIPVMVKFYLPLGLNLQAGPQFGVLTNAESEGIDVSEVYKNSDLSAAFGAGIDLPFGLQVTARYVLGLSNISDDPVSPDEELKNRVFQLSVGYSLFKLGK